MANILLVEDDAFLTTMYKTRFEAEGYSVAVAEDGETALRLLTQNPPSLALLDIMLPKLGGLSILEELARRGITKKIPILILSNLTDQATIAKAKELGVRDFLIKAQYTPTQIVAIIKKYLPT